MKQLIKQKLSKKGLSKAQFDKALLYCNERYKEGFTLKEIHDVLTQKKHMHPLAALGKDWFPKLVQEIK